MSAFRLWCLIVLIRYVSSCSQTADQSTAFQESFNVVSPDQGDASLPFLHVGDDGHLYHSWVEQLDTITYFKYSKWMDGQWQQAMTITKGNDWFVNWADYPMISVSSYGSTLAHFLKKSSEGTYSYDVNMLVKKEDIWTNPFVPHFDATLTEHGFVSMVPLSEDRFQVAWLDGRNTEDKTHDIIIVKEVP